MPAPDYGRAPGSRAAPPDQHRPKFAELPRRAPHLLRDCYLTRLGPLVEAKNCCVEAPGRTSFPSLGNEAILAGSSNSLTEINAAIDQQCVDPANPQDDAGPARSPMADS